MKQLLPLLATALLLIGTTAQAGPIVFDATLTSASGPPFPTGPITFLTEGFANPPDDTIPIEIVSLSLRSVTVLTSPQDDTFPVSLTGSEGGLRLGGFGTEAIVDVGWQPPPDDQFPTDGVSFDLFLELLDHPGSRVSPVLASPPDDQFPSPTAFDVFFEITLADVGTALHTAHFEIGGGQPLTFDNISVGPPGSPKFPIVFDLVKGPGAVDKSQPLVSMTMSGEFTAVPEPSSLTLLGLGALSLLGYTRLRKRKQAA
ncbi:MAG: PEP-CTERM sorting domain-containing protein [Planctomycetaceae bacterium]